jgi:predicted nucleotidyltransferase
MINDFLDKLKYLVKNHSDRNDEIKWYFFGSYLKCNPGLSDIDLLIVYKSEEKLPNLKTDLEQLELQYPLDITFLNENEEKELDFINTVNAVRFNK